MQNATSLATGQPMDRVLQQSVHAIDIPPRPLILDRIKAEMHEDEPDFKMLEKLIFADVAQPDQTRIVALNAEQFLKQDGNFVISIKASCTSFESSIRISI